MKNKDILRYSFPVLLLLLILAGVVFLVNNNTKTNNNTGVNISSSQNVVSDNKKFEDATALLLGQDNQALQDAFLVMSQGDFKKSVTDLEVLVSSGQFSGSDLEALKSLLVYSYLSYGSVYYKESENAIKARELLTSSGISQKTWFYNYYMAYSYEIENNFEQALKYYTIALDFGGIDRQAQTLNQIGHVYDLKGNFNSAVTYYTQAYNKNPDDIQTNLNLGRTYTRKGELSKAKIYFENIVDRVSDKFTLGEIYFNLSSLYLYGGEDQDIDYQSSIEYAQKAVDINPDYPLGHLGVARVLVSLETQLDDAKDYLDNAIELNPNLFQAHKWLGLLYQAQGEYELSIESFQRSLDAIENDITVMSDLQESSRGEIYYFTSASYAYLKNNDQAYTYLDKMLNSSNILAVGMLQREIQKPNYGIFEGLEDNEEFKKIIAKLQ